MDLFEAITKRRSIRKFKNEDYPDEHVEKALRAALLAPNSSNTQTWNFYWIKTKEIKEKIIPICLDQSAARTASQFVVITADPKLWKRSQSALIQWVQDCKAPPSVLMYYRKLIPLTYRWGFLNSLGLLKWLAATLVGLFRPMMRSPFTKAQIQEVAIKSAALAAENFVLAITAQGGATCMMEGFDECRLKSLLKMSFTSRVLMVIAIGYEAERGTWGPQFRLPFEEVVKKL
ncbi:MAG: nitroreductase family protein [Bdellovibrionales bacterium]